jgi:flagellar biosynthesis chaperone FliJ
MTYEDLVTMKAFLMALENLEQPLPEDLQIDLGIIAAALPESAYELHDLAERYDPLNQEYLSILRGFPGEGERLKFVPSEMKPENGDKSDHQLNDIEILIQQLQRQIAQTSAQLNADRPVDDGSERTTSEHCYTGASVLPPEVLQVQSVNQSKPIQRFIRDLGWTEEQIAQARYAFTSFQEDWDDPAMEVYNDL